MTPAELAAKLLGGGDPVAAEVQIRQQIASQPRGEARAEWWVLLSLALTKQKRLMVAEETCRFALTMNPANADGQYLLSQILIARDSGRQSPYWRNFQMQRPRYLDYPRAISIETVGRCNARCSFCPNGEIARRYSAMSDDLFSKILRDLQDIPRQHEFIIYPNIVNEPFMDPRIFDRCRRINELLPQGRLVFYSNFSFLPPRFLENLATLRNVHAWNISLNSADPAEYSSVMGLNLDKTVANVNVLLRYLRSADGLRTRVRLSRVQDESERDAAYLRDCAALFPDFEQGKDFEIGCKARTDWLGRVETARTETPYAAPCGSWFDLNIFCDGRVPHCCMDAHGDYAIGDVRENSLLEIYNRGSFRALRESASAREGIHPCRNCPLMQ